MSWNNESEWTYVQTFKTIKWAILGTLAAVALVGALLFADWKLKWIFYEKDVEQQAQVNEQNAGTQQHRADRIRQLIRDFNVIDEGNEAGRSSIRIEACDLIDRLSDAFLTDNIKDFANEEC